MCKETTIGHGPIRLDVATVNLVSGHDSVTLRADESCYAGRPVERCHEDLPPGTRYLGLSGASTFVPHRALRITWRDNRVEVFVCGRRPVELSRATAGGSHPLDAGETTTLEIGDRVAFSFVGGRADGDDLVIRVKVHGEAGRQPARVEPSTTTDTPVLNLDTAYGRMAVCLFRELRHPIDRTPTFSNDHIARHHRELYGFDPSPAEKSASWMDRRIQELVAQLSAHAPARLGHDMTRTNRRARLAGVIAGLGLVTTAYLRQRAGAPERER